jgi:hypothetical protein
MRISALSHKCFRPVRRLVEFEWAATVFLVLALFDYMRGTSIHIIPIFLGVIVILVSLYRDRIKARKAPPTTMDLIKRLPKRRGLALAAVIKGDSGLKVVLDLKSCTRNGDAVLADVFFVDEATGNILLENRQKEFSASGRCAFSVQLPNGFARFSVDLKEGVNRFRFREPTGVARPVSRPPAGRFGRMADAMIRDAKVNSKEKLAATRRAIAKALHPDAGAPTEAQDRSAALAWANAELDRIQASLIPAR